MASKTALWIVSLIVATRAHSVSLIGAPELDIHSILRARSVVDADFESLHRRATACGNATGVSCPSGQCCGANGYCGTGVDYCKAPDCQFQFGPACDANTTPQGQSTASIPRPLLGSVQYGGVTITNCAVPGTVAMTYDDGPGPYTAELLDTLAKAQVKATFFITGNNNGKGEIDSPSTPWPAVIKRMYQEGHQIASHTWSHADLDNLTTAQRTQEMVKNEMAFVNILGFFPTYMRPPFTYCSGNTGCTGDIAKLGYHIVDFMIDTKDYLNDAPNLIQNSKDIFASAFANANPQTQEFLPYAHDIHEQSVVSLTPYIIQSVLSKGFKMVTVGECLNDPVSNWYRNPNTGGVLTSVPALAASTVPTTSSVVTTTSSLPVTTTISTTTTTTTTTSSTTTTTTTIPSTVATSSSTVILTSTAGTSSHTTTTSSLIATTSHTNSTTTTSVNRTTSVAAATTTSTTRPNAGERVVAPLMRLSTTLVVILVLMSL